MLPKFPEIVSNCANTTKNYEYDSEGILSVCEGIN